MKILFWLYSIAALAFYGFFIITTVGKISTPEFNIFITYLIAFVASFADYLGLHRMTRSMFGRSIVLAIPDFLHDYVSESAIMAVVLLIVLFLLSPVLMALCIIFHIVGCFKTLTIE